jgi:hypothetical protein
MMKHEDANPSWGRSKHTGAWDRVKEAFARDWDQTKHDFSNKHGHELEQNLGDTVKQATGRAYAPPPNVPNVRPTELSKERKQAAKAAAKAAKATERAALAAEEAALAEAQEATSSEYPGDSQPADVPSEYREVEPALRYGYGAAMQRTEEWDLLIEAELRDDWEDLDHERSWEEVKEVVRIGWNRARSGR